MRNLLLAGMTAVLVLTFFAIDPEAHSEQANEKVPAGFAYPEAPETVQIEATLEPKALSGTVTGPDGAAVEKALVERLEKNWNRRLAAVFCDSQGRFI